MSFSVILHFIVTTTTNLSNTSIKNKKKTQFVVTTKRYSYQFIFTCYQLTITQLVLLNIHLVLVLLIKKLVCKQDLEL